MLASVELGGDGVVDCAIKLTVLRSSWKRSKRNFWFSMMQRTLSLSSLRRSVEDVVGGEESATSDGELALGLGEIAFTAFRTSKFIKVSRGEEPDPSEGEVGEVLVGGIAFGATFKVAALFLSSSRSLNRVVSISIVSARSFLSIASLAISSRQASRSTFKFSLSNSSGVSAKVFFVLLCLLFRVGAGSITGAVTTGCDGFGKGGGIEHRETEEVIVEGVGVDSVIRGGESIEGGVEKGIDGVTK